MARLLRLEFVRALYHATAKGDRGEAVYEDDANRHLFLSFLDQICETYNNGVYNNGVGDK